MLRTTTRQLNIFFNHARNNVARKSVPSPMLMNINVRHFSDANSEKVKKLSEEILTLTTLEMNQLIVALQVNFFGYQVKTFSDLLCFCFQAKLGISDAMLAGVGSAPAGGGSQKAAEAPKAAEPEKPKEAFNIKIGAADAKAKIKIIKEVRSITGLGLKEAKELVEKAPVVIKEGVKKEEAEQFKKLLTDAGATVELL
jgi:large subunit ribosomal protein L7/L12